MTLQSDVVAPASSSSARFSYPRRSLAFGDLSDDELAARCQRGDKRALVVLIERYRRFARAKDRNYFLVGADADDVEQEALIGLYKAIRDFRPDHNSSFRAFVELCTTRQVITAIKAATRQKHQPLNRYVSISGGCSADEAEEPSIVELLPAAGEADPVDRFVSIEQLKAMWSAVAQRLSPFEVQVLMLYVEGNSYQEIGGRLGRRAKSIDNALQRIKRKLDAHLAEDAEGCSHEEFLAPYLESA